MLSMLSTNPNQLNEDEIFADREQTVRYLERVTLTVHPNRIEQEKATMTNRLTEQYGYSDEEVEAMFQAAGYIDRTEKVVKLPKPKNHAKKVAEAKSHVEFLHSHEHSDESYITLAQINYTQSRAGWHQYHYHYGDLINKLNDIDIKKGTYMSVNEFYVPKRSIMTLRYLTSFYVDIDAHSDVKLNLKAVKKFLNQKYKDNVLPRHSHLTMTGRGVQVYWKIEPSPSTNLWLWQIVEDYIIEALQDIEQHIAGHQVDSACSDCSRVFRLEGTNNPKSNTYAKCLESNDNIYRMSDILNDYFADKYKEKKRYKNKVNPMKGEIRINSDKVIKLNETFQARSRFIRQNRCKDLWTLLKMRNYDIKKGFRNEFLLIYAWTAIENLNVLEKIESELLEINNLFKDSLSEKEVLRFAKKVYDKYTKSELKKTALSGSLSKKIGRYCFRNDTIIRKLDIQPHEYENFITILPKDISEKRKNDRHNEQKRLSRRNENGLTQRQQSKVDLQEKIINMKLSKTKNKEIAESLNISLKAVEKHITELRKIGRL